MTDDLSKAIRQAIQEAAAIIAGWTSMTDLERERFEEDFQTIRVKLWLTTPPDDGR